MQSSVKEEFDELIIINCRLLVHFRSLLSALKRLFVHPDLHRMRLGQYEYRPNHILGDMNCYNSYHPG